VLTQDRSGALSQTLLVREQPWSSASYCNTNRNTTLSFPQASTSKLLTVMLKAPSTNSTARRINLVTFIDLYSNVMPVACRNCQNTGVFCKVHVHLERCNKCDRQNLKTCNIQISANEWSVIQEERERLLACVEANRKEAAELAKALRANEDCAAEEISVEEANIVALEQQEATSLLSDGLAMLPFT
jgi:hypothetical protein